MTAKHYPYPAPSAPKPEVSEGSIRQARAVPPESFRAQATGVGQATGASRITGAMRALAVVGSMPAAQRQAVPKSEGYPTGGEGVF